MASMKYMAGFAAAGLVAGALAVAAFAGAASVSAQEAVAKPARTAPSCLDGNHTGRIHVVDEKTLLVYDTAGNPYKLGVSGPCRSMTDFSQIGFVFNGSTQICRAYDAKILRSENGMAPVTCLITSVESISRDAALVLDPD